MYFACNFNMRKEKKKKKDHPIVKFKQIQAFAGKASQTGNVFFHLLVEATSLKQYFL